ncbi:MAG: RIP metalloprotease RseP [Eubacteriales bacterium]|nr:RIP metalloprotease RseP [Eubacteriales bacterium]
MNIAIAFLALNLIILIHEFGHFIVAKLFGIKVDEFSLFVGPKIFSFKKGETTYSLRLIPILAYVKLEGEEEASDSERSFGRKPVWKRAAVISAGPIMNLLLAIVLLTAVFTISGYSSTGIKTVEVNSPASSSELLPGDKLIEYAGHKIFTPEDYLQFLYVSKGVPAQILVDRNGKQITTEIVPDIYPAEQRYLFGFTVESATGEASNLIAEISKGMPAEEAGLKAGDRIIRLNDTQVVSIEGINSYMKDFEGGEVRLALIRDGVEITINITPRKISISESYYTGIDFDMVKGNIFNAAGHSFVYAASVVRSVVNSLVWLIKGDVGLKDMMGPVGMVSTIGAVVEQSRTSFATLLTNLFSITAMFSIALGATNLIPFPALDGNKLLLLGIEAIRKKPIPPEKEAVISMIGFILLIILAIFTFYNDIARIILGR